MGRGCDKMVNPDSAEFRVRKQGERWTREVKKIGRINREHNFQAGGANSQALARL